MFQSIAERVAGNGTGADRRRWLVLGLVGAIVAAGLVAVGRWTAPSSAPAALSAPSSQIARHEPAAIDRATPRQLEAVCSVVLCQPGTAFVMPSPGMQRVLEHF